MNYSEIQSVCIAIWAFDPAEHCPDLNSFDIGQIVFHRLKPLTVDFYGQANTDMYSCLVFSLICFIVVIGWVSKKE